MNWNAWGRWAAGMLVVGCGSKLEVDHIAPGQGGSGGTGAFGGSDVVVVGGTGGTGTEPPGTLGQRCITGGTTTDAMGTVAQADVVEPDHCDEGLTCGSDGVCATIPNCPQTTGVCVVRAPDPGATSSGGAGGSNGLGGASSGGGTVGQPEPTVSALAADAAHLYWVEYGTRDSLGNYRNDGALMSFAFDGGVTQAIASALPGPIGVGVTSTHAYVYVDGAPLIGSPIHSQLLRVPLAGGTPELVQDGAVPGSFLGVGNRAFWANGSLYQIAADSGAVPSVVLAASDYITGLAADATSLYFLDQSQGRTAIDSVPLSGGSVGTLGLTALTFGLKDEFLYGIEEIDNSTGLLLDRAAKSDGSWQRIRALGAGGDSTLQIAGDRYFWSSAPPQAGAFMQPDYNRLDIQTASFTTTDPPVRLMERSVQQYNEPFKWLGTATTLFWSDGRAIYARAL